MSLVALVPTTANPPGAVNVPSLNGASAGQLNAALGGANPLATNPSTSALLLAPTPLGAATPLPPVQASQTVLGDTTAGAAGGRLDSGLLPQSIPEPGVLALFVVICLASAMRRMLRGSHHEARRGTRGREVRHSRGM
jgi:hypothetical protein